MFANRRRRGRALPILVATAALAGVPVAMSVLSGNTVADASPRSSGVVAAGGGAPGPADAVAVAKAPVTGPQVFAELDDLHLRLPSERVRLVGFHEASKKEALGLTPRGVLVENANTTRITPPADVVDGTPYVILSSRGRTPPPTSAVDMVMEDDDPVLSPVTGEVTDVREYFLYGQHQDHRIEIRPEGRPDLRVVLIHVADVAVQRGDRVEAGVTALAGSANRFDFGSHIDRYLDERLPHVHLEVKSAG